MALQINSTLNTPEGYSFSGGYINIQRIVISKEGLLHLTISTFISQAARESFKSAVSIIEFPSDVFIEADVPGDVVTSDIYTIAYTHLKTYLQGILGADISDV